MRFVHLALPGVALTLGLSACATEVDVDQDETDLVPGPTAEFDPGAGILPVPTNLVLDPETGTLDLPAQCGESATATAIREGILNELDGFGTFKVVLRAPLSAPVDVASLDDRVWLLPVARAGQPLDPAMAEPVPVVVQPAPTVRFDENCANPTQVSSLVIVPQVPLEDDAVYAVALLAGITSETGEAFEASTVWSLVRQSDSPVVFEGDELVRNATPFDPADPADLERLRGLAQLWAYHDTFLPFLDAALDVQTGAEVSRRGLLVAWAFSTQTIEQPLDPAADGIAAGVATATTSETTPVDLQPGATGAQVMDAVLCGTQGPGCGICTVLPCAAVGQVKTGFITSPSYQVSMSGVPTVWSDPISPALQAESMLPYLAFVPATPAPPGGYPVVIFGHGLRGNKGNLFAIASQLAGAGLASIAIDHVAHGDRAVQISSTGDCAGDVSPGSHPACFAPFLSDNLAVARDNVRQSIIDQLKLVEVLKACGLNECDGLPVDEDRIGYMGQSLGSLIGVTTVSVSDDIRAAVLNVGGVGWVDVAIHSDTPAIICPTIDTLIDAGILEGQTWDGGANPDALCLMPEAWQNDPGFLAFASTARWVYDPADGANFLDQLLASDTRVLMQKVVGDTVVPNEATDQMGALLGLSPVEASIATDPMAVAPTPAAAAEDSGWISYETGDQNAFNHGSLLAPAPGPAGTLGTQQMQTDAITFLVRNL